MPGHYTAKLGCHTEGREEYDMVRHLSFYVDCMAIFMLYFYTKKLKNKLKIFHGVVVKMVKKRNQINDCRKSPQVISLKMLKTKGLASKKNKSPFQHLSFYCCC